ncbi:MAG TPA: ferredoxin--NADP reductase [Sandaracinaceae bacterium LLY-WYZ-13_1]|nr:ferredoxin--NADP reductase [Sandaracinaceae bacterium LLY-WYZ-13_1]
MTRAASRGARRRPVDSIDVTASAVARLSPRFMRPRIDQLRLDARSLVDGFRGPREPTYRDPETPALEPTPLAAIDPIEHVLPRRLRRRWVTLRTDLSWLARDLRGEGRPYLVERRGPSRWAAAPGPAPVQPSMKRRKLRVATRRQETPDAVSIELVELDGSPLSFEAGQFLSFHLEVDGEPLRRAYSLSTSPLDGPGGCITVKRVSNGRASNWIHDHLAEGAELEVLGPSGSFVAPAETAPAHLVLVAGGSGITPVISIAETVLRSRPELTVSLVYGNRRREDVIFHDRLAELAERFGDRLRVEHVLEEPPEGWTGPRGRLDADQLAAWLDTLPTDPPALYYLCGPGPMMDAARETLLGRGVSEEAIREERFNSPQDVDEATEDLPSEAVTVQLKVKGRDHLVRVEPGQTLLEAGLAAGAALPFSCAMGGCAACKGKLTGGSVKMEEPNCLSAKERDAGWVLTCCSRPLGAARVEVA